MKKIRLLTALLLSMCLLTGCGARAPEAADRAPAPAGGAAIEEPAADGVATKDPIPFDEIEYARPVEAAETLGGYVETLRGLLSADAPLTTVTTLLDRCYEAYYHIETMYTVAQIRSDQDMTDTYYSAEYDWCYDALTEADRQMDAIYYLCGGSALADRLERDYFWEGFAEEYADESESLYTDRMMEFLRRENELLSEYRSLVAAPVIQYMGQELDLWQYLNETDSYDDYYGALLCYYQTYNEDVARIYIDLVRLRAEMAAEAGYDSYEQMQYEFTYERDYDARQAERYLADIREELVPLYRQTAYNFQLDYGYLSEQELYEALRTGAERMGGDVWDAFRFMSEYRLYDIAFGEYKANQSYQTYLSEYECPFIFLDPYTDLSDVTSFAHEFGHFLDSYLNYNAYETLDVAEVFSQAMELLMLHQLDGALTQQEQEMLLRIKLSDVLDMYVQQGAFAQFEHMVYSADPETLDAETVNGFFLRCCDEFGFYDGYSSGYFSMCWMDITHFFEYPFYVISYPVSHDLSMQIYGLELGAPGAGLEKLLELLNRTDAGLLELADIGGLASPFAEGRVARVAADLRELLPSGSGGPVHKQK